MIPEPEVPMLKKTLILIPLVLGLLVLLALWAGERLSLLPGGLHPWLTARGCSPGAEPLPDRCL